MSRKAIFTLLALTGVLLAACSPRPTNQTGGAQLPNPASVYCEENGGKLEIRTAADGSQSGACVFPDGTECDEWAYFRGECKPGEAPAGPTAAPNERGSSQPTGGVFAGDGCRVYSNSELGYTFHYPADAEIIDNDDPSKSISIVGPLVGGEHWPQITIAHPTDNADYRPPEPVDMRQWLTDHYLLADQQLPDVQIAGTTAIHVRHDRSPQSYAYDRYYFAHSGQLYVVMISHAGDKEDWTLYDHFLQSFKFDEPSEDCPCKAKTPMAP